MKRYRLGDRAAYSLIRIVDGCAKGPEQHGRYSRLDNLLTKNRQVGKYKKEQSRKEEIIMHWFLLICAITAYFTHDAFYKKMPIIRSQRTHTCLSYLIKEDMENTRLTSS